MRLSCWEVRWGSSRPFLTVSKHATHSPATHAPPNPPLALSMQGESDAYSYLSAKQRLSLREDDARQLMRDVLAALCYMHERVRGGHDRMG